MTLPMPNLDDKTFDQLVDEAIKLIPVYAPGWTDHNLHDPGITLIELFAWLTEMQLYSLNRISDKHRIKYLNLLGTRPLPAQPAKVSLSFAGKGSVRENSKVTARMPEGEESIFFETDTALDILPVEIKKIWVHTGHTGHNPEDVTDFNQPINNFFYPFGEKPRDDSQLYIGFDFDNSDAGWLAAKTLSMYIKLYEVDIPALGQHGDEQERVITSVDVEWSYNNGVDEWVPLDVTDTLAKNFYRSGMVHFNLPSRIKRSALHDNTGKGHKLFWVRCKVSTEEHYEIAPRVERLLVNTVPATEGETSKNEKLGESTGLPNQVFKTRIKPVIRESELLLVEDAKWTLVEDFYASGPESKHYMLGHWEGEITFGDGINGMIPPKGAAITLKQYRYGAGERGNVGAYSVNKLDGENQIFRVTNYFPATGGREEETIEEAVARIRNELRTPYTAVTFEDYETIARSTPGLRVARVKAIAGTNNENTVTVAIVPYSFDKPVPSSGFKATVLKHLDKHRLITTGIEVVEPDYTEVSISAKIKAKGGTEAGQVRERCLTALNSFLSPIKIGENDNQWPFGRPVYRSEVYEVLEDVDGVDYILELNLSSSGGQVYVDEGKNLTISETGLVYPGRHFIEIEAQIT